MTLHPVHSAFTRSLARNLVRAVLLFAIIGSVTLVAWLSWRQQATHRATFIESCRSNTGFIRGLRLRPTEKLATQLSTLLGLQVRFPLRSLDSEPLQGVLQQNTAQGTESIRFPLDDWTDVQFTRSISPLWSSLASQQTWLALGLFWALALLLGYLLGRGLVRPLTALSQNVPQLLAGQVPSTALMERPDEIGSLTRALHEAGKNLNSERTKRLAAERLAVLARIATGLAHEIKNPLSAIQLHAQLLPDTTENAEAVSHILQETRSIEDLVNQWLFLARPEPPGTSPVTLQSLFSALATTYQPRAAHAEVQLQFECQEKAIIIQADRTRLLQALGNLVLNAIQVSSPGDHVTLQAERIGPSSLQLRLLDEGPGFSPAALAHGTELFFSEKEGGMGVGLNIASQLIEAHGGTLQLSNRPAPARGGLVTLTLPTA